MDLVKQREAAMDRAERALDKAWPERKSEEYLREMHPAIPQRWFGADFAAALPDCASAKRISSQSAGPRPRTVRLQLSFDAAAPVPAEPITLLTRGQRQTDPESTYA